MNSLTTNRTLVAFIAASLLLAGCAQVAPATEEGSAGSGSGSGSGSETLSTDCSIYVGQTVPDLTLFTSNAVASGHGNGQVFG
ncbi:hypothetical protein, partial [Salinibacterium sp.]|uniref:hypothetical protein n=1 Tax=Salinibacterium sp. TaxID=1915057 RepID=UPI0037C928B7